MPDKPYATALDANLVGDPTAHIRAQATAHGASVTLGPVHLWSPSATQLLNWLTDAIAAVEKAEKRLPEPAS